MKDDVASERIPGGIVFRFVRKTIFYDFDLLLWRFDPFALQSHLSDTGIDSYLERLLGAFGPEILITLTVSVTQASG